MHAPQLADLQAFATVARLCSFRKAAVEMGVTPSALSHTMRGLEARLGIRLLNRTTRSVSPTEAGQQLLARLSPALLDIASALEEVNAFRDSPMGTLRINAPKAASQWVLAPLVSGFLAAYPGMRVEVVSDDAFVDIVADGFDAGVRFGESLQQDMIAVPLGGTQRFVVIGSPAYMAQHGKPKHPKDLQNHRCMRVRFPSGAYYRWEFAKRKQKLDIDVDGPLATNDLHLMVEAAKAGLCLTYTYEQFAQPGIASGALVTVLDDWCPAIPGFFLYYPSRKLMPAGLRAFIEYIKQNGQA